MSFDALVRKALQNHVEVYKLQEERLVALADRIRGVDEKSTQPVNVKNWAPGSFQRADATSAVEFGLWCHRRTHSYLSAAPRSSHRKICVGGA